jgi:voltage-gated potassium channel
VTVGDGTESRLGRWERRSEWPLAAIAVLLLIVWSVQVLAQPQGRAGDAWELAFRALWGIFLIDYLVRLRLAADRRRWFVRHIPELAMVALPFLRPLRLLRLPHLFRRLHIAGMGALRGRLIVYTAVSVALLSYAAALAIFSRDDERSKFPNFGEALWWSIRTVTTLGYGGKEPEGSIGRAIAVVLGLGGICLIGVVTTTFSSWIVQQVADEEAASQAVTAAEIDVVRSDLVQRIDQLAAEVRELKGSSGQRGEAEPEDSL